MLLPFNRSHRIGFLARVALGQLQRNRAGDQKSEFDMSEFVRIRPVDI